MNEEILKKGKALSIKIAALKEDIKVLSSKNVNSLWVSLKENYSCSSHQLTGGIVDEKFAHSFLLTVYSAALIEAEKRFEEL